MSLKYGHATRTFIGNHSELSVTYRHHGRVLPPPKLIRLSDASFVKIDFNGSNRTD